MSAPRGCVCLLPGGVCLPPGGVCVSALGGCLLPGGVCSQRGVSALGVVFCSRGVCLLLGGVCSGGWWSAPGGEVVCSRGGVCSWGGGGIPSCTEADTLPVNRITHTCKNITLAQLRCGR